MSCSQATLFQPKVKLGFTRSPSRSPQLYPCRVTVPAIRRGGICKAFPRIVYSESKRKRFDAAACSAKGENSSKGFAWGSSKKEMGGLGQGFLANETCRLGFGGGGPPRGYGGGDGAGDYDDQNSHQLRDETLQVILATIGFIVVYTYLLSGAELTRLARDYIKYLMGAPPSPRLLRTIDKWREYPERISSAINTQKEMFGRATLTLLILCQNPRKLVDLIRRQVINETIC